MSYQELVAEVLQLASHAVPDSSNTNASDTYQYNELLEMCQDNELPREEIDELKNIFTQRFEQVSESIKQRMEYD